MKPELPEIDRDPQRLFSASQKHEILLRQSVVAGDERYALCDACSEEIAKLSNADDYLVQLRVGFSVQAAWSGLLDLLLVGANLSDLTMAVLFQLLAASELTSRLRQINLQNNQCSNLAMKALLVAFYPVDDLEEGEDYRLDEDPALQQEEEDSSAAGNGATSLTSLDLAQNRFGVVRILITH